MQQSLTSIVVVTICEQVTPYPSPTTTGLSGATIAPEAPKSERSRPWIARPAMARSRKNDENAIADDGDGAGASSRTFFFDLGIGAFCPFLVFKGFDEGSIQSWPCRLPGERLHRSPRRRQEGWLRRRMSPRVSQSWREQAAGSSVARTLNRADESTCLVHDVPGQQPYSKLS